jgi:hypothetical protein
MRRKGHNYGLSKPMNTKTSRKTRLLYKAEIVSNCCLSSINFRENWRGSQEWTIQRHWQSINVRGNRRGSQEWTIQRHWQSVNVRENRRGNQEWTIQKNW